jgi:hypothetical protein
VRGRVTKIDDTDLQRALLVCLDDADGDFDQAMENVERWFDDAMGRVSGRYRRKVRLIMLGVTAAERGGRNLRRLVIAGFQEFAAPSH